MDTNVLAWAMGSAGIGSLQRNTTLSLLTLTSSSTAFIPAASPAVVAAAVFSHAVCKGKCDQCFQNLCLKLTVLSPPLAPMM